MVSKGGEDLVGEGFGVANSDLAALAPEQLAAGGEGLEGGLTTLQG